MDSVRLSDLKAELVAASADTEKLGLCRHKTGNLSVINREEGYVIITPSGVSKLNLDMQDLIVCGLDGEILKNPRGHRPSIELSMHLACYRKRPHIGSLVHTHSTYASVFAVKGKEIPPLLTEAEFYGFHTKCVPYEEPGSRELAERVGEALDEGTDVLLLEKHGIVVVGDKVADTVLKALYVEEAAKVAFLSMLIK